MSKAVTKETTAPRLREAALISRIFAGHFPPAKQPTYTTSREKCRYPERIAAEVALRASTIPALAELAAAKRPLPSMAYGRAS